MIRIVEHIPNYADGLTPRRAEGDTTADVLAAPWVAKWTHPLINGSRVFHRFSVSAEDGETPLLMVEFDQGRWWWVVARVTEGTLDLPRWEAVRDA